MTAAEPAMRAGRVATLRALLLAAVVAVVIGLPAVQLFAHRPAPFGWQMYSGLPRLPQVWTLDASGTATPVEMGDVFARHRVEMDFRGLVVSALCGDGAVAVRILAQGETQPETVACQ